MKEKLKISIFVSAIFLITGCSFNLKEIEISKEQLSASVLNLDNRSNTAANSYKNYKAAVDEKYGDSYLSKDKSVSIEPTGIAYDPNSQLISADNSPDYACVELANGYTEYDLSTLQTSGRYYLWLEYYIPASFASSPLIQIEIDNVTPFNEASSIVLPLKFEDNVPLDENGKKDFESYKTKYGDQMSPNQKRVMAWQDEGLYESTFSTSEPLVFDINERNNTIKVVNLSDDYFYVGKLNIKPVIDKPSYLTYHNLYPSSQGLDHIELNAIDFAYKNTNDATLANEQSPAVYPYEDGRKLLNVTSGWDKAGQSIIWNVDVKSAGFYPFHLKKLKTMNFQLLVLVIKMKLLEMKMVHIIFISMKVLIH